MYGAILIEPILVTLIFIFVNIPMMEKHILTSIPTYSRHQKQIFALKPMPGKRAVKPYD